MVDSTLIPKELWLLIFEFLPKSAHNPIVFTQLSHICRSASSAFRSDQVWRHVNPYGLERDIHHHFTITMTVLNPTQRQNIVFVWGFVRKLMDPETYDRFDDTPTVQLYYHQIPDLAAHENDYYNLGLLLCTTSLIRDQRVTTINVANKTLLKNAMSLDSRVYLRVSQDLQFHTDIFDFILRTDSNMIHSFPLEMPSPISDHQMALGISSSGPDLNPLLISHVDGNATPIGPEAATALARHRQSFVDEIPIRYLRDRQFILDNIAFEGALYFHAPKDLQEDPEFRRKAVAASSEVVDETMDLDLWKLAVWAHPSQKLLRAPRKFLPHLLQKSLEKSSDPRKWFLVHSEVEGVKDIKQRAVELFSGLAHEWPELVPSNRRNVLESIKSARSDKSSSTSSVYLPQEHSNDHEIVMAAVSVDGTMLKYARDSMRDNKEIVLQALKSSSPVLEFVSNRLREDKEVVTEALAYNGMNLGFCTLEIKNSKEFVKIAVANRGKALRYASDELRTDKDLLLRARCSMHPEREEDIYQDPFYDQFAEGDPYMDMVNQMNLRMGLAPMESEGKKLEYFELVI